MKKHTINMIPCLGKSICKRTMVSSWLLLIGFTLCFLSGCENDDFESDTPFATYSFKGKVVDDAGKSIPNAQIKIITSQYEASGNSWSDATGNYELHFTTFGREENIWIVATTLDRRSTHLKQDTIPVSLQKGDFIKNNKNWHIGSVHKEINISLKNKL